MKPVKLLKERKREKQDMNKHNFRVYFKDGTIFYGNSFQGDWKRVDITKQIVSFYYVLGNKKVLMDGYKEYNHKIEKVSFQRSGITKILLMGRKENYSDIIMFDVKNMKICVKRTPIGSEYNGQILSDWKKGELDDPKYEIETLNHGGM